MALSSTLLLTFPITQNPESSCSTLQGHSPEMVVDGRTLNRILGTQHEPLLAELADRCSGVVVCRASPSQKATIVRMMKRFQTAQLSGTVGGLSPPAYFCRHQTDVGSWPMGRGPAVCSMSGVVNVKP